VFSLNKKLLRDVKMVHLNHWEFSPMNIWELIGDWSRMRTGFFTFWVV